MKKIRNILFVIILGLFISYCPKVFAWQIISSKSSVSPGGSFTIRASSDVIGRINVSVSNGRASSGSFWTENGTAEPTVTITANSSGTVVVNVSCVSCSDANGNAISGSDSVSVRINGSSSDGSRSNSYNEKEEDNDEDLSDNNYLKSLSVDGFKLSPEFNKNTLEYTIEVDETTDKVKINASTEDDKAKVEGVGEKSLKDVSSYQVVVTAENGKTRTYTLKFVFKDSNPIKVKKGNKTYTVVKRKSELVEFDDYKYTTIKINNIEVPALYNKTTKLTLVGLKYKDKVYLYRYDSSNNNYVRYIEYDFKSVKLVLFKPSKKIIPTGFKSYKEKINGHFVQVYKQNRSSNYSLIYGMNVSTGKKGLYLYDKKENTVQRYASEMMTSLKNENNKIHRICIGLCGAIALLIIVLLIILTKKDKRIQKGK